MSFAAALLAVLVGKVTLGVFATPLTWNNGLTVRRQDGLWGPSVATPTAAAAAAAMLGMTALCLCCACVLYRLASREPATDTPPDSRALSCRARCRTIRRSHLR